MVKQINYECFMTLVKRFSKVTKMKITMKDIAKEAGVSVATVSHVINGTKRISEEKHLLIRQAIEKYNYVPDIRAKNLRLQKTRTAGLVVSSFPDVYVTGIVNGVGNRARELGYHLLFVNTNEDSTYERDTIQLLGSNMVDGIILSPTSHSLNLKEYMDQKVPLVFAIRYDPNIKDIPRVTADDFQAGYDATVHMIRHGHKNIGIIYAIPNVTSTNQRIEGYRAALKEYHIPFNERYLEIGHATVEGGFHAAKSLLKREKEISSLFVLSDLMTIGSMKALINLSLKCPEDIALIGFGDFEAATVTNPPISSISLPPDTIGRTAFDLLLNKMNNPNYFKHVQIPTSLVPRKSCGC
jgi:LacI family transcriptional regulator